MYNLKNCNSDLKNWLSDKNLIKVLALLCLGDDPPANQLETVKWRGKIHLINLLSTYATFYFYLQQFICFSQVGTIRPVNRRPILSEVL